MSGAEPERWDRQPDRKRAQQKPEAEREQSGQSSCDTQQRRERMQLIGQLRRQAAGLRQAQSRQALEAGEEAIRLVGQLDGLFSAAERQTEPAEILRRRADDAQRRLLALRARSRELRDRGIEERESVLRLAEQAIAAAAPGARSGAA